MVSRRASIADDDKHSLKNNRLIAADLLRELKERASAVSQLSTQIISPYHTAINDLFGECSQLNNLVDSLFTFQQRAPHNHLLPDKNLLFVYIDKLTALQVSISLILQNATAEQHAYPALWGTAQEISEVLRDFAQANRNAAIIAANHCRREFENLFANNCQQLPATHIAARALLSLAGIQSQQKTCQVFQRSHTPDQLIFSYENLEENVGAQLQDWLMKAGVKSASFTIIENEFPFTVAETEPDSEATANFQFDEDIVLPVNSATYEWMIDAAEYSQHIMPLVRNQAVQLSKTPRGQSFSSGLVSSSSLWSSHHSSSAETSKNASDDEALTSSDQQEEKKLFSELINGVQKLTQSGSGRTTPRSTTQSPRAQKSASGKLSALRSLGSSAEVKDSGLNKEGALKRSLK